MSEIKKLGAAEFLAKFDPEIHERIKARASWPGVEIVALFENLQMDSSAFGERTAMIAGPGCTLKSLDDVKEHYLYDLPSQRQYPVAYVAAEDLRS